MHAGSEDTAMEDFLARVQQHGGLTTRTEADRLTRTTLSSLAERISGGQMGDLSPGLPMELRPEVEHGEGHAKAFDKNAFLDRITGDIETVDIGMAEQQVRAVLRTLHEWAPEGEIDDTLAQLPPDLAALFE